MWCLTLLYFFELAISLLIIDDLAGTCKGVSSALFLTTDTSSCVKSIDRLISPSGFVVDGMLLVLLLIRAARRAMISSFVIVRAMIFTDLMVHSMDADG